MGLAGAPGSLCTVGTAKGIGKPPTSKMPHEHGINALLRRHQVVCSCARSFPPWAGNDVAIRGHGLVPQVVASVADPAGLSGLATTAQGSAGFDDRLGRSGQTRSLALALNRTHQRRPLNSSLPCQSAKKRSLPVMPSQPGVL